MRIVELDTPAVLLDLDRVERNLTCFQDYCDRHRIRNRPHIETHKLLELARRQVKFGAVGICYQKLGEAEVMAQGGLFDILVPFDLLGPVELGRARALAERVTLRVSADDPVVLDGLAEAFASAARPLPVLVECDTGARRCGVQRPTAARELALRIDRAPGLAFAGLSTYPAKGVPEKAASFLAEAKGPIEAAALEVPVVSSGGTPDMWRVHEFPVIGEYRVGTYVSNDRMQVAAGAADWEDCALTVLTTVASRPTPDRAILDAGSKSLTSDLVGQSGHGRIVEYPEAVIYASSEEHGHVDLSVCTERPQIGEKLRVIPDDACPVSNLFDRAVTVRGELVEGCLVVAVRGRVDRGGRRTFARAPRRRGRTSPRPAGQARQRPRCSRIAGSPKSAGRRPSPAYQLRPPPRLASPGSSEAKRTIVVRGPGGCERNPLPRSRPGRPRCASAAAWMPTTPPPSSMRASGAARASETWKSTVVRAGTTSRRSERSSVESAAGPSTRRRVSRNGAASASIAAAVAGIVSGRWPAVAVTTRRRPAEAGPVARRSSTTTAASRAARRAARLGGTWGSVGEQDRHRHVLQDVGRGATQDELPQARMAVGSHHQKVGPLVGGGREQHVARVEPARGHRLHRHLDTVPGEMGGDVGPRHLAHPTGERFGVDHDQGDVASAREEWQRVVDRARRLARAVPGDEHPLGRHRPGADIRYDERGPPRGHEGRLDHQGVVDTGALRVGLTDDREIGVAGVAGEGVREPVDHHRLLAPLERHTLRLGAGHGAGQELGRLGFGPLALLEKDVGRQIDAHDRRHIGLDHEAEPGQVRPEGAGEGQRRVQPRVKGLARIELDDQVLEAHRCSPRKSSCRAL